MRRRFAISRTRRRAPFAGAVVALAFLTTGCPVDPPPPSPILSLGSGGVLGDNTADGGSVSADGRWVAFQSRASNLVAGDVAGTLDVFLRDTTTDTTTRIASDPVSAPRVSNNGRYVGLRLATGGLAVYDRDTQTTATWTDPGGGTAITPLVTPDGTTAIYGAPSSFGVFSTSCRLRDMATGTITNCPSGIGTEGNGAIITTSANGRFVVYSFQDYGGGPNGSRMLDRQTGSVVMLPPTFLTFFSLSGVSDDGRYLTTLAPAGSLITAARLDLQTSTVEVLPGAHTTSVLAYSISPNGRYLGLASASEDVAGDDTNGKNDVFVWDVDGGAVRLASGVDGATLAGDSIPCGNGTGQIRDDGSACVATVNPLTAADTNSTIDLYRG